MNVCYIITSTIKCGPVNVLFNLVRDYQKIPNFKPYIITLKSDDPKRSRRQEFKNLGIEVVQFDERKQMKQIKKFIAERHCQVIHSHGIRPDMINGYLKKHWQYHCLHITTLHNYPFTDYVMGHGKIKGILMANLEMFSIRNLVKVACSKAIQTEFLHHLKLKVHMIENGVIFPPENEVMQLEKYNDQPTFLYLGDVNSRKQIDFLVRYFAQHPEYNFWIVGDGPEYVPVKEMAATVPNVTIFGRTTDPTKFYQKADYFISNSSTEGLPMAVLEALSWGMPVILSNIDAHRELVNDNNGQLFNLNNCDSLNSSIKQLINTDYNAIVIYENAKQRFSSEHMMNQYYSLYNKLINK